MRLYGFLGGSRWLAYRSVRWIAVNFSFQGSYQTSFMLCMFSAWLIFKIKIIRWQFYAPSAWRVVFKGAPINIHEAYALAQNRRYSRPRSKSNYNSCSFFYDFLFIIFCCWILDTSIMGRNPQFEVQGFCKDHGTPVNCSITLYHNGSVKTLGPYISGNFTARADLAGPGVRFPSFSLKINQWMSLTNEDLTGIWYTCSCTVFRPFHCGHCSMDERIQESR